MGCIIRGGKYIILDKSIHMFSHVNSVQGGNSMSEINSINFLLPNKLDTTKSSQSVKPEASVDFSSMLKNALKDVNGAQLEADDAVQKVLSGETNDIHSTMIALQKADVSLKMMLEVRNKIMEAYQEVMRTQI